MSSEHTTGDHCPDCFNAGYDARDQRAEARTATTEKVKHTGGPWTVGESDRNGQAIVRGVFYEIATCWHHGVKQIEREMEANAVLIAASPEMLSALEQLAECNLNEDNCASFEVANRRIRNIVLPAIRRAKGE